MCFTCFTTEVIMAGMPELNGATGLMFMTWHLAVQPNFEFPVAVQWRLISSSDTARLPSILTRDSPWRLGTNYQQFEPWILLASYE